MGSLEFIVWFRYSRQGKRSSHTLRHETHRGYRERGRSVGGMHLA